MMIIMLNGSAFQRERVLAECMRVRSTTHIVTQETGNLRARSVSILILDGGNFSSQRRWENRDRARLFFPLSSVGSFLSVFAASCAGFWVPPSTACRPSRQNNHRRMEQRNSLSRALVAHANLRVNVLMCDMRCFKTMSAMAGGGGGKNGKRRVYVCACVSTFVWCVCSVIYTDNAE